jgi:phosphoribosylanthranilate isomerase
MRRTRIKICGVCRPEDARFAAECGADAIGMVFHGPSPRNLSLDQARAILDVLPPLVTPVALFVDAAAEKILDTARALGIRTVQLHGDEPPELVAALNPLTVLKAVCVEKKDFPERLAAWKHAIEVYKLSNLAGLLLETANTKVAGGAGIPNDWQTIRDAQSAKLFDGLPPLIAAGGLTPETVEEVVRLLRPYAVDVSSGVEEERRQKSPGKIEAFVAGVRKADHVEDTE